MNKNISLERPKLKKGMWRIIIDDLLEVAYGLKEASRSFLLKHLDCADFRSEHIRTYPCFAMDRLVVVVAENHRLEECWVYHPDEKKIVQLYRY